MSYLDTMKKLYPIGTNVGFRYGQERTYTRGIIVGYQFGLYGEVAKFDDARYFYLKIRVYEFPDYFVRINPRLGIAAYYTQDAVTKAIKNEELF